MYLSNELVKFERANYDHWQRSNSSEAIMNEYKCIWSPEMLNDSRRTSSLESRMSRVWKISFLGAFIKGVP